MRSAPSWSSRLWQERLAAGSIVVFGGWLLWLTQGHIRASATFDPLGSVFFVRIVGTTLVLAGSYIMWRPPFDKSTSGAQEAQGTTAIVMMAISAGYVALMPVLGYLAATSVSLFVILFWFGIRSFRMLLLIPVITTGVLYVVFAELLNIRLP